jgi:hypothetical protein
MNLQAITMLALHTILNPKVIVNAERAAKTHNWFAGSVHGLVAILKNRLRLLPSRYGNLRINSLVSGVS